MPLNDATSLISPELDSQNMFPLRTSRPVSWNARWPSPAAIYNNLLCSRSTDRILLYYLTVHIPIMPSLAGYSLVLSQMLFCFNTLTLDFLSVLEPEESPLPCSAN